MTYGYRCDEPISAQYYETPLVEGKDDREKLHLHCWNAYCESEGLGEYETSEVRLQRGALGWFRKQGRLAGTWKVRWAAVQNGHLCYFTDDTCKVFKGSVMLQGATVTPLELTPRGGAAQAVSVTVV